MKAPAQNFPQAARHELADAQLRANLGNATATIRAKRARVVEELPDWQALRDAGSAIKADVMANLDRYLLQFEAALVAAGATVRTRTAIGEPVGFIEAYMASESTALSGKYVHVRDDWRPFLEGKAVPEANRFLLRRTE